VDLLQLSVQMPLYWLCYRRNNGISVVIELAHSVIYARLRASIDGLDEGVTKGHELDRKSVERQLTTFWG